MIFWVGIQASIGRLFRVNLRVWINIKIISILPRMWIAWFLFVDFWNRIQHYKFEKLCFHFWRQRHLQLDLVLRTRKKCLKHVKICWNILKMWKCSVFKKNYVRIFISTWTFSASFDSYQNFVPWRTPTILPTQKFKIWISTWVHHGNLPILVSFSMISKALQTELIRIKIISLDWKIQNFPEFNLPINHPYIHHFCQQSVVRMTVTLFIYPEFSTPKK